MSARPRAGLGVVFGLLVALAPVLAGAQDEAAQPESPPASQDRDARADAEERIAEFIRTKVIAGWACKRTPHFLVVHDEDVDDGLVRRTAYELEAFRAKVLAVRFPSERASEVIAIARICESRSQFVAYGAPAGAAAYWSPLHRELVGYQDRNDRESLPSTMRAVAADAYFGDAIPTVAVHDWFRVGVGETWAGASYEDGDFVLAPFLWRASTAKDAKRRWRASWRAEGEGGEATGPALDLREWLSWNTRQFRGNNAWRIPAAVNSAIAWSLVYFLETSPRPELRRILQRYYESLRDAAGNATADAAERPKPETLRAAALTAALEGVDCVELERAWLAHSWE